MTEALLDLQVRSIACEADGIFSFDLRPMDGSGLPVFTAGAHIDVVLPNGAERSYSLINPQSERNRYVIAVARDRGSRGGSQFLCEVLRPGEMLRVRPPSNHFSLVENAGETVFIAGGIGITPIWCMIQRLEEIAQPGWRLFYAARTRRSAAFVDQLLTLDQYKPGRVKLTFDGEPGQVMLDLDAIVAATQPAAHLYCCGPTPMLRAFEAATAGRPPELVHCEYFTPAELAAPGGFTVELARSRRSIFVPQGKTILETLLAEGLAVMHSCREGVCGTCETVVLEGIPDHRDQVLSARERAVNKTMMICRSGCRGDRLMLDL